MKSLPPHVGESIASLVKNGSGQSVSVQQVISMTRKRFPRLAVSDERLIEIIASEASSAGRGVEFNGKEDA
jgi:hypothetical protein